MPVDQFLPTRVVDFYGDEIVAVEDEVSGRVFVPLARLCDNMGIDRPSQLQRIQEHAVLQTGLTTLRLQTAGGPQESQCLRLDLIPFWLAGINVRRVRPEIRDKLILYQRECAAILWDAFRPTGLPSSVALNEVVPAGSAAQAYEMAMAIATVARQQMQLETQMTEIAASVMEQGRRLESLEITRAPRHAVSESQAAELAQAIKVVARELALVTRHNEYGAVYGQLYREFGITSYKSLPLDQFERAMEWLRDWFRTIQRGETLPPVERLT